MFHNLKRKVCSEDNILIFLDLESDLEDLKLWTELPIGTTEFKTCWTLGNKDNDTKYKFL